MWHNSGVDPAERKLRRSRWRHSCPRIGWRTLRLNGIDSETPTGTCFEGDKVPLAPRGITDACLAYSGGRPGDLTASMLLWRRPSSLVEKRIPGWRGRKQQL